MTQQSIAPGARLRASPRAIPRSTDLVQQAHRRTVDTPVDSVVGFLQTLLSRRITAYIAGVKDAKSVSRWAAGETTDIRDPAMEQRLRTAYAIAQMLSEVDNPQTIKAWFVSLNPQLDDVSPSEAIREGNGKEVMAAARAFVANG